MHLKPQLLFRPLTSESIPSPPPPLAASPSCWRLPELELEERLLLGDRLGDMLEEDSVVELLLVMLAERVPLLPASIRLPVLLCLRVVPESDPECGLTGPERRPRLPDFDEDPSEDLCFDFCDFPCRPLVLVSLVVI